tara:strand:+ start:313 stop:489 length:177 start_codon:yes stop_codon:yes gene_type:complete
MLEIQEIITQLQFESNFINKELIKEAVIDYVDNTITLNTIEESNNLINKIINKIYNTN